MSIRTVFWTIEKSFQFLIFISWELSIWFKFSFCSYFDVYMNCLLNKWNMVSDFDFPFEWQFRFSSRSWVLSRTGIFLVLSRVSTGAGRRILSSIPVDFLVLETFASKCWGRRRETSIASSSSRVIPSSRQRECDREDLGERKVCLSQQFLKNDNQMNKLGNGLIKVIKKKQSKWIEPASAASAPVFFSCS